MGRSPRELNYHALTNMRTLARRFSTALLLALAFLMSTPSLHAQVPQVINYQGRVLVGAVNFNGTGKFAFALVNGDGTTTYWSNDGSSVAGSMPATAVSLTVSGGLYSVLLGDTTVPGMTPIPYGVFVNPDVRLRTWFNDGTKGFQLLTPDQRIASVGYAMAANSVNGVSLAGSGTLNVGTGGTLGSSAFSSSTSYVQTSTLGAGVQSALSTPANSINGFATGANMGMQPLAQSGPNSPNFVFIGDSRTAGAGADMTAHGFVSLLRGLGIDNNGTSSSAAVQSVSDTSSGLGNSSSKIYNLGMGSQITADAVSQYYGAEGIPVNVTWTSNTTATITSSTTALNNLLSCGFTGTVTNGSPNITNIQVNGTYTSASVSVGLCIGQTVYSSVSGFPTAKLTAVTGTVPVGTTFTTTVTMASNYTGASGTVTFFASNLYQNAIVAGTGISTGSTGSWAGTTLTLANGTSSNGNSSTTVYWGGYAAGGNHLTPAVSGYASGATVLTVTGSTTGIVNGMVIGGPGIVPGTTIAISGTTLTLSNATTAAVTNPSIDLTIPVRNIRNPIQIYPEGYLGSAHQLSPLVTGNGVIANGTPGYIVDAYGINDCYDASGHGVSPAASLASKHTLYGYARADGYTVVGTTVMPCTTNAFSGFNDAGTVAHFNALQLLIQADAYSSGANPYGWNYLFDVASLFPTTNNSTATTQDSRWYYDGIHPSDLGHGLIAQYIAAQFFSQGLLTQAGTFNPLTSGVVPSINIANTYFAPQTVQNTFSSGGTIYDNTEVAGSSITINTGSTDPATLNLNPASSGTSAINFKQAGVTQGYMSFASGGQFTLFMPDQNYLYELNDGTGLLGWTGAYLKGGGVTIGGSDPARNYVSIRSESAPTAQRDLTFRDNNGVFECRTYDDAHSASMLQWDLPNATSTAAGDFRTFGNLISDTVGKGVQVTEGSNAKQGTATLVAGTVTVKDTAVTGNSRIFLTTQSLGTVKVPTVVAVTARSPGTSFTITSADSTDTSVVAWEIFEPAP
jgi:hypothetical protein